MTIYSPAVSAGDVLSLKKSAEVLRDKARSLWKWPDRKLEEAVEELNYDLLFFCRDLGDSAVFSKMPAFEDDFACLWAMFLKGGEPGTQAWDNDWLFDSPLRALPLEGFFTVLAALGGQQALWILKDYGRCLSEGRVDEAAHEFGNATRHLKSGEKAMTFVEEQRIAELEMAGKASIRI